VSNAHQEVVAAVETPLHRAPAECKVLATILFVLAVALVPRG
jgi:cobalt/nickel transport system permease protein